MAVWGPASSPSCSRASTRSPPPCRPLPGVWQGPSCVEPGRGGADTAKSQGDPTGHFHVISRKPSAGRRSPPPASLGATPPGQLMVLLNVPAAALPSPRLCWGQSEEGWAEGRPPPPPTPLCTAGRAVPARPGESTVPSGQRSLQPRAPLYRTPRPAQQLFRPGDGPPTHLRLHGLSLQARHAGTVATGLIFASSLPP